MYQKSSFLEILLKAFWSLRQYFHLEKLRNQKNLINSELRMRHKDASWQLILSASGSEFQNTLLGKAKMDMEEINGNFLLRWNEDYEKSTKNFRQRLLNPRFSKFEGLEAWVNNKKVFIIFIKEKLQESRATIIERTHKKGDGQQKVVVTFFDFKDHNIILRSY